MPRITSSRLQHAARVYEEENAGQIPFADLLEMSGASVDVIVSPDAKVELLHEAGAIEAMCKALDDKTFAARAGLGAKGPGTLLAYLVRASNTLWEALELAQRFYTMQDPDIQLSFVSSGGASKVTLASNIIPSHQYPRHREFLIFGLYRRIQQITSNGLGSITIELETDDLDHCRRLSQHAGCAVEGCHDGYAIRLPPNGMDFQIPTADPALLGHLRQHGEDQLRAQPDVQQSLSENIVDLLEGQLPGRVPHGDEIASQLGMTRRTMTRRLSSEGTNYRAVLEGVLCNLAKKLLRNGESIAQVAFMLDFADQAAFSVAFKRWTGATPARFKRAAR